MDFIDKIQELAGRIPRQLDHCQTEEATKNALIMPFINALGYDVFNPTEVVPEFTADIGTKKGEKVDYAIMRDGKPVILFECKWSGADLNEMHASQLFRYFSAVTDVRFGVVTNGVVYRFHSDLESPNRMDEKPFFEFNMLNFHERDVNELKKFTKSTFNLEEILTTASELKYTAAIKRLIAKEFESPSEEFVRFLGGQVYSGRMTQSVREQFTELTQKALKRFLTDRINKRLKSALESTVGVETAVSTQPQPAPEEEEDDDVIHEDKERGIMTTGEEMEGYFVVKSILRNTIDVRRIYMRDTKSYCGVLLDDNNRKPVCRLHFNRTQKYIGLLDEEKNEERVPIDEIDDIYQYAERIIETARGYDSD